MTKSCFIISSIGDEGSEIRRLANEKFDLVFKPVLIKLGYDVIRADKIGSPGSISREIVSNVINSDLVIADISDGNPNVFYELAIRNAVKKPVIVFRKINQVMPFDIYDTHAIDIDRSQPRIWENAKNALRVHVVAAEKKPESASESILSSFTIKLDAKKSDPVDEIHYILKDIQQQVRNLSKIPPNDYVLNDNRIQKIIQKSKDIGYDHVVGLSLGSSSPGCEKTHDCYSPHTIQIKKGESVLWVNEDTAAHTVTAGTPTNGPSGEFDSKLFMSGNSFSHTFDMSGEFPYFDMLHPWMAGIIIVE